MTNGKSMLHARQNIGSKDSIGLVVEEQNQSSECLMWLGLWHLSSGAFLGTKKDTHENECKTGRFTVLDCNFYIFACPHALV